MLATRRLFTILSTAHKKNTNYEITTNYNVITLNILSKLVEREASKNSIKHNLTRGYTIKASAETESLFNPLA
jgi:hypothetical protein